MIAMDLGLRSGSAPATFLSRIVLAAPISRTTWKWSSCTSTCAFVAGSFGKNALKLTAHLISKSIVTPRDMGGDAPSG